MEETSAPYRCKQFDVVCERERRFHRRLSVFDWKSANWIGLLAKFNQAKHDRDSRCNIHKAQGNRAFTVHEICEMRLSYINPPRANPPHIMQYAKRQPQPREIEIAILLIH